MFHVAFLSDRNATHIHIHPVLSVGAQHTYQTAIPISSFPRSFPSGHYPAVSFVAHAAKKIVLTDLLPVFLRTIGGASLRVNDTARFSASSHDHIIKGIHDKLFIVVGAHCDAYWHISIQVQNTGYIELPLSGRDHRCITEHFGIRLCCCKISVDQVICYQFIVIRICGTDIFFASALFYVSILRKYFVLPCQKMFLKHHIKHFSLISYYTSIIPQKTNLQASFQNLKIF